MPATLTLRDETATGDVVGTRTLDFPAEEITVRELIARRVAEEVREHNRAPGGRPFAGLVRPAFPARAIDPERQRDAALAAFAGNGFFVLVGDRQVEDLDEIIRLELHTEVSFVRLLPLVGG